MEAENTSVKQAPLREKVEGGPELGKQVRSSEALWSELETFL